MIVDEFTYLEVSRQRKYQLRNLRDNRCPICGKPKVGKRFCLKHETQEITATAIRTGLLIRQKCEFCELLGEAHHDDYSKPLDVRWLCEEHHLAAHGKTPKENNLIL